MNNEHRSPVTISDVARAAGVSTASVSSVINGRARVSATTKERILAAINELGYQINPTARMLRAGRTDAIGLVVPELNQPYFGQLATHLADQLGPMGKHLVVQRSGGSREQELAAASFARLRMYDGVIISVVGLDPQELERLGFSTPVVLIGERSGEQRFDHIAMDNQGGAATAVRHLVERDARRIALLGGDLHGGIDMSTLRTAGYVAELRACGLEVDERLVVPMPLFDRESGRRAVHSLAADGVLFDAVFAMTDVVALGALRALSELGLRVPEDVQVVGFDNITESAYSTPALTSIDPNKPEIARTALSLLMERIDSERAANPGDLRLEPREIVVNTSLVHRESTRA